jgi:hypothetical protein
MVNGDDKADHIINTEMNLANSISRNALSNPESGRDE